MQIEQEPIDIAKIARIYFLNPNTLEKQYKNHLSDFNQFKKYYEEDLKNNSFVFPENFWENIAIDETSISNWELYTIILNKDFKWKKWSIAAIIKWTKSRTVTEAVLNKVPYEKLLKIKEITLDLSNSMDWIARQIAPQAILTYDRFHVQKIVSEVVQEIRVKHRWKAIDEENDKILKSRKNKTKYISETYSNWDTKKQLLARSRHLLYKPSSKWTNLQRERSVILFKEFPSIKKAYNLSMYFRNCYENKKLDKDNAKNNFKSWINKIRESWIKEFNTVTKTIETHLWVISNYFINRSTNANIESFNAKIKLFRRNTRWVLDKDFFLFRLMNYFT